MAESSFAMDSDDFTALANKTANAASEVDANFAVVRTDFNAAMNTTTGHYHDGTGSRLIYGGITGATLEEFAGLCLIGVV